MIFSDQQMHLIRVAAATLRLGARDRFMQDLALQLAPCHPVSDSDVAAAIRQLLGVGAIDAMVTGGRMKCLH
jgi:hypothetical protein